MALVCVPEPLQLPVVFFQLLRLLLHPLVVALLVRGWETPPRLEGPVYVLLPVRVVLLPRVLADLPLRAHLV